MRREHCTSRGPAVAVTATLRDVGGCGSATLAAVFTIWLEFGKTVDGAQKLSNTAGVLRIFLSSGLLGHSEPTNTFSLIRRRQPPCTCVVRVLFGDSVGLGRVGHSTSPNKRLQQICRA